MTFSLMLACNGEDSCNSIQELTSDKFRENYLDHQIYAYDPVTLLNIDHSYLLNLSGNRR